MTIQSDQSPTALDETLTYSGSDFSDTDPEAEIGIGCSQYPNKEPIIFTDSDCEVYANALLLLRGHLGTDQVQSAFEADDYEDPEISDLPVCDSVSTGSTQQRTATVSQPEISNSLRSKIRSLRHLANWPYRKIAAATKVALGTVHRICSLPETPRKKRLGRTPLLGPQERNTLITLATATAENRRKTLCEIAEIAGIEASEKTIRRAMASEGYHRRIARAKPYLSATAKQKRLEWAIQFLDWRSSDWNDVIFTDECAFNVGGCPGNTWVTRTAGEEFFEDCLIPKFRKLDTIMVWGCIVGGKKGRLIIWDRQNWGKTMNAQGYCEHIVRPVLYPFWQEVSRERGGYIYIQQDGAPPHRAKSTMTVFEELGVKNYILPWAATSPDANIIEHVWLRMKETINRMSPRPTKNPEMKAAIQAAWDMITDDDIKILVESLPTRVAAIKAANGGCTRY